MLKTQHTLTWDDAREIKRAIVTAGREENQTLLEYAQSLIAAFAEVDAGTRPEAAPPATSSGLTTLEQEAADEAETARLARLHPRLAEELRLLDEQHRRMRAACRDALLSAPDDPALRRLLGLEAVLPREAHGSGQ